jgi:multidrug efflux system membrane fusion protein
MKRIIPSLLSFLIIACGHHQQEAKIPTPVKVKTAEMFSASNDIRYSANIQPRNQVTLSFKVGGYIEKLHQVKDYDGLLRDVQQGDHVKRGTVLAFLQKRDYQAKAQQAKAALTEAQAGARQAKEDFERTERLYKSESATKSDYDALKAKYEAYESKVDAAKAQLDQAAIASNDSDLTAPIDSVVISRSVESGDLASAGTPAFVLADTRSVKAVFGVPDLNISKFQIGQTLSIVTEAIPGVEFQGTITRISPAADTKTRLFETEITIPNPEGQIRPGMIATILVKDVKQPGATVLVVPLTAIVRSKTNTDQYAVMVVKSENGKQYAHSVQVTLGQAFGDRIAINQGLQGGEQVITTGATIVIEGEEVVLIP